MTMKVQQRGTLTDKVVAAAKGTSNVTFLKKHGVRRCPRKTSLRGL